MSPQQLKSRLQLIFYYVHEMYPSHLPDIRFLSQKVHKPDLWPHERTSGSS